jgi:hypothetical protein
VFLPISSIQSAPSRLAAGTADSPTAPSPITVADVRGPTPAFTAQWWPVHNTSDKVSSDGSSGESSAQLVPHAPGPTERAANPGRDE